MDVSPSFDKIAPVYDRLAQLIFGKSIVRAQTCFLSMLPENAHVLIIGGGTGWIITELLQRSVPRRVDYVEASARMIAIAQNSWAASRWAASRYQQVREKQTGRHQTQVHFIQGTEKNLPPESHYDAVMTFFVLDMYQEKSLKDMMQKLYDHLNPGGYWLFADFKISRNKHWWHQPLVSSMYLFFRLTCRLQNRRLPDYEQAFGQLGLTREKEKLFFGDLISSVVYRKAI